MEDPCVDEICDPLEEVTREEAREALSTLTTPNSAYAEESRKYRRSVYMHNEWVRHRSSDRFYTNLATISRSGVGIALRNELILVSGVALFVILANCLFVSYHDFAGIEQPGPLSAYWFEGPWSLPSLPFTIAMPALSLLLVFRTNTAYSRWNEARTLWGGVVNNCRNIVRQSNTFYATDERGVLLRDRMVGNTIAFCKALRNFLRGPTDDRVFERELRELADAGLIPRTQVRRCMQAKNRPMFCVSAMSANLRKADIDAIARSRIDSTLSILVDLLGACERIFKSPVPLVYTRHTARFLAAFLLLLPFGLFDSMGNYWNHWPVVPATFFLAFFLFGIEEIGIQIEEPFSILPLEALCDGAIEGIVTEMCSANDSDDAFEFAEDDELHAVDVATAVGVTSAPAPNRSEKLRKLMGLED